jgi:hypothetical protein
MKKFVHRILGFFILLIFSFSFIFWTYFKADPYMDFGSNNNYSWKYFFQQLGDLSTKKLISSNHAYNSFIFGSSRTTSIYACYLNKIIPGSDFFHFGNWNETIGGIYSKLKVLDSLGYSIDNVMIYLDTDYTFYDDGKNHVTDHYLMTKKKKQDYLFTHFNSYYKNLTTDKIKILLDMPVEGNIFPNWKSDPHTNDPKHCCGDHNTLVNYPKIDFSSDHKIDSLRKAGILYHRSPDQQYKKSQISETEKDILYNLMNLLKKHGTNYYAVITPLYDQYKFSHEDLAILKDVFGDRLHDFSGINQFTIHEYNYPDGKHFQPYISKCIIDSIMEPKEDKEYLGRISDRKMPF